MGSLAATVLLLVSTSIAGALPADVLPARELIFDPIVVAATRPASFDLIDFRAEQQEPPMPANEVPVHSLFVRKTHFGVAVGDDNGLVHTSLGFYLTVAEWGRFNFGVPAVEVGIGRYPDYNRLTGQTFMASKPTLIISLVSVHYRVQYIRALGVNWYLNFEQVHDMRQMFTGSQFGISFSRK